MNRNKLIVFSAPSGAGKTTLVKHILSQFSNTNFSISATSRSPRGNEKDGVDYHFLSNSEFKKKLRTMSLLNSKKFIGGFIMELLNLKLKTYGQIMKLHFLILML